MTEITRLDKGPRMSQAAISDGTIYLAGQIGTAGASVAKQTEDIVANIDALLERAGSDKSHMLQATIWLSSMDYFAEMNAVWDGWIDTDNPPTRACGEAKLATPDYKVEIIIIAKVK
jgi:enamine deaminase RidA (YjgF/YER057c/UK114 family)